MSTISSYILDLLNDDIVSHGLLVQCVEQAKDSADGPRVEWKEVLEQLLSGEVEIGVARSVSSDYVEFVAWKGTVRERIARAAESVDRASSADQEFAYWLCLRGNVDRFEDERSPGPATSH